MSGGYRCVHVPVNHGSAVAGARVWLVVAVLGFVAWHVLGPWVILGPLALAAAVTVTVVVVRHRKAARLAAALPVSVSVVRSVPPAARCAGCGWRHAVATLSIGAQAIPVCGPCQGIALRRIATGQVRIEARP